MAATKLLLLQDRHQQGGLWLITTSKRSDPSSSWQALVRCNQQKDHRMSLALARISLSDFYHIHSHLTHHTVHSNMHMRESRQRDRRRTLRYLHAMTARSGARPEIEGMISGPSVFWHYKVISTGARTQLNLIAEQAGQADLARIERRFLREVLDRIAEERLGQQHFPRRTSGEFYLRRWNPGSAASHPACALAVQSGVLDHRFVSVLEPWRLQLLHP